MTEHDNSMVEASPIPGKQGKSWALATAGWLFAAGAVAFAYMLFQGMSKPRDEAGFARFAVGAMQKLEVQPEPRPQSSRIFKDTQGAEKRLSDWRGQVILVNFWAQNCAPCVKEMPTLAALDKAFEGQGFEVVPIATERLRDVETSREKLTELAGGQLPFLVDTSMTIALDSGAPGLPTTILYDRQGRELARLAGEADWGSPEAKRLIEAALQLP